MSIVAVAITAVVAALLSLSLRRHNAELSFLLALAGCAIILGSVLLNLSSVYEAVQKLLSSTSVSAAHIGILLRAVGICFLTEFACDCCIDAGQRALANNVAVAGKVMVLLTAVPLYEEVLNTVIQLAGV